MPLVEKNKDSKKLLNKISSEDEDFNQSGCCLMLCVLPWKPSKIHKYLIGNYSTKDDKKSRKSRKSSKGDGSLTPYHQLPSDFSENKKYAKKYYNTFHKSLPPTTNRNDGLQIHGPYGKVGQEENEFSNNDGSNVVYDFTLGQLKVNNSELHYVRQSNFYESVTSMKMWPFFMGNRSPIKLLTAEGSWMLCEVEASSDFVLCILSPSNQFLFLANINEDNYLGIYTEEMIEGSEIQRYVWRYESIEYLHVRKSVIRCVGPTPNLYITAKLPSYRLALTEEFSDALNWNEI